MEYDYTERVISRREETKTNGHIKIHRIFETTIKEYSCVICEIGKEQLVHETIMQL